MPAVFVCFLILFLLVPNGEASTPCSFHSDEGACIGASCTGMSISCVWNANEGRGTCLCPGASFCSDFIDSLVCGQSSCPGSTHVGDACNWNGTYCHCVEATRSELGFCGGAFSVGECEGTLCQATSGRIRQCIWGHAICHCPEDTIPTTTHSPTTASGGGCASFREEQSCIMDGKCLEDDKISCVWYPPGSDVFGCHCPPKTSSVPTTSVSTTLTTQNATIRPNNCADLLDEVSCISFECQTGSPCEWTEPGHDHSGCHCPIQTRTQSTVQTSDDGNFTGTSHASSNDAVNGSTSHGDSILSSESGASSGSGISECVYITSENVCSNTSCQNDGICLWDTELEECFCKTVSSAHKTMCTIFLAQAIMFMMTL